MSKKQEIAVVTVTMIINEHQTKEECVLSFMRHIGYFQTSNKCTPLAIEFDYGETDIIDDYEEYEGFGKIDETPLEDVINDQFSSDSLDEDEE